jgi:acyl carrier protein
MEWSAMIGEVARFARVPAESIDRDSTLIEDLGFDSLALTELLVTLIEEHDVDALSGDLFARSWENVTLAELYENYCRDGAPMSNGLGAAPGTPAGS